MSLSIPPPLPPPTVPRDSSPTIPPPPASVASTQNATAKRRVFEAPSAPIPESPSSIRDVGELKEMKQLEAAMACASVSEEESPSGSVEEGQVKRKKSARRWPKLQPFRGHTIAEAGGSMWLDARVLLVLRLVATAMLISHLVFFSLRKDFSFRRYDIWSYVGLTVAFLAVLMCSLVQVLRMSDDQEDEESSEPRDEEEGQKRHIVAMENGSESRDSGFAYALAQITVPVYQLFVTAILFSTVVYWAAIHSYKSDPFGYPVIAVHVAAPAVALVDMLLSMSMRFRFVYIPMFVLYNAAYGVALWAFYKIHDFYVYQFLDPSIQPRAEYVAKCAALAVATLVASVALCTISIGWDLLFAKRRGKRLSKKREPKDEDENHNDAETPSEGSTESSHVIGTDKRNEQAESKAENADDREMVLERRDSEFGAVVVDEVEVCMSVRASNGPRDRHSAPIITQEQSLHGHESTRRWRRASVGGVMAGSSSQASIASSNGGSLSESRTSAWDLELDALQATHEDEFFRMPGVYTVHGEEEVVKLAPLARSGSGGGMSRSSSGRKISRSGSGNALSRSGSAKRLSRSGSAKRLSRKFSSRGLFHS